VVLIKQYENSEFEAPSSYIVKTELEAEDAFGLSYNLGVVFKSAVRL
jgi:hypothetical protein